MSVKTWDILHRETGRVRGVISGDRNAVESAIFRSEVAYCPETGEVVYHIVREGL